MIKSIIETVAGSLSESVTFIYATPDEANVLLEDVAVEDFPVFVYLVPADIIDRQEEGGTLNTEFQLLAAVLDLMGDAGGDFDNTQAASRVDELRALAREFIHDLKGQDVVHRANHNFTVRYPMIFPQTQFDLQAGGVMIQIDDLMINEVITGAQ